MIIKIIKRIYNAIMYQIRWEKFNNEFKRQFPLSNIVPTNIIDLNILEIGKLSYGELAIGCPFDVREGLFVKIGNYVSIAKNVKFLLDVEHPLHNISTFPFDPYIIKYDTLKKGTASKGPIIVNDDVWIGESVILLSGITIGQGAVIAAGAVVTKDVEPYSIVGGVPARFIKWRYDKEIRDKLVQIDYSRLTDDMIINNMEKLYEQVTAENVDELIAFLPKLNETGSHK